MRNFHISDVLTATTGRLLSSRHMGGVYDIYNFLTGDSLFTHQLPRAARECQPWLDAQFPALTESALKERIDDLDRRIAAVPQTRESIAPVIAAWVEEVRCSLGLPAQIPVYELGADMHTRIDPLEEACAMVGDAKVIALELSESPE